MSIICEVSEFKRNERIKWRYNSGCSDASNSSIGNATEFFIRRVNKPANP
jgi:hypothetical protein